MFELSLNIVYYRNAVTYMDFYAIVITLTYIKLLLDKKKNQKTMH